VPPALAIALVFGSPAAEAHGHPPRGPVVVGGVRGGGFYGPFFGLSPFWGPYGWGPYPYPPGGGIDLGAALIAGYGALELNAKPGQAEVWVDGKFVAEARELDGYPSYLWLAEGAHKVVVYKGGYSSFEEEIEVRRGVHRELKIRLEKGESAPPGLRPGREEKAKKDKGPDFSL
jgi:hypothetical protein